MGPMIYAASPTNWSVSGNPSHIGLGSTMISADTGFGSAVGIAQSVITSDLGIIFQEQAQVWLGSYIFVEIKIITV